MRSWTRAHWTILIALLGLLSLHLKGAHSWGEALSYDSLVELFGTAVTVLSALNVARPKDRTKIAELEDTVDEQGAQLVDARMSAASAVADYRRRGTMVGGGGDVAFTKP